MIKHYYTEIERADFGDLLSSRGISKLDIVSIDDDRIQPPTSQTLQAGWSEDPKGKAQLPQVIICKDGCENDWAAWITTYAAKIRPFSAHMRLMSHGDFQETCRQTRTPTLGRHSWAAAGVVLGEVLASSGLPDRALEAVPAAACASTLSFAMFRAAALYSHFWQWPQLVTAWSFVREATKQRHRAIDGVSVSRVCAIIVSATSVEKRNDLLTDNDTIETEACRQLLDTGLPPSTFSRVRGFVAAESRMHGPREDRVLAFTEFVRQLEGIKSTQNELFSLVIGYLASRIAPGTIQHSSILAGIVQRFPTAVLWYGFCAGIGEGTLPNGVSGRSIDLPTSARRVLRDILRHETVFSLPTSDISVAELASLSKTNKEPFDGLITWTHTTTTVEIAPCIWTAVNLTSKAPEKIPERELRERTLANLGQQIDRLRATFDELLGEETVNEKGQQQSLFPSRRRKK